MRGADARHSLADRALEIVSARRVGVVWPEAVRDEHLAELERFVGPKLELDIEPVDPAPESDDGITLTHVEGIARDPNIGRAARRLAERGAEAVAYGCTSGSYVLGSDGDAAIVAQMQAAARTPATTTSSAVVAALRELGVQQVAVLSPHIDDLNERLRAYLETSGCIVASMIGLNRWGDIEAIEPEETRGIIESRVDVPAAEAVFISCTGMRTAEIINDLESSLGKPVITANQATLWQLANLLGIRNAVPHRGRLLAEAAKPAAEI